jgi:DNA-binding ferritin-like protein
LLIEEKEKQQQLLQQQQKKSVIGDELEDVQERFDHIQKNAVSSIKEILQNEIKDIKQTILQNEKEQLHNFEEERRKIAEYVENSRNQILELSNEVKKRVDQPPEDEYEEYEEVVHERQEPGVPKRKFSLSNEPDDEEWREILQLLKNRKSKD